MTSGPRLLLTGASGFIGRRLAPLLAAAPGVELFKLSRDADGEALAANLTDLDACRRAIAETRPDIVVHLAGAASVAASQSAALETWQTNFGATLNLGGALAEANADAAFVFASSAEVYGTAFNDVERVNEASPVRPANVYGRTKLAGEMALQDMLGRNGRVAMLRLFNSFGPGQDERFVVSAFAAQIARIEAGLAEPVLHVGNLTSERDFIDVRDTVRAIAAVAVGNVMPRGATILNVCSGRSRPVEDVVFGLKALATADFEIRPDPSRMRASEVPRAAADPAALKALTGWRAEIPWEKTLADTLDDWRRSVAAA